MLFEHFVTHTLNRFLTPHKKRTQAGLMLGRTVDAEHAEVVWPDAQRCEHAVILGKTGTGKTHFLELLALQLAHRGEGFSFFDFHGDASLSLIQRLLNLPGVSDRLVIVDPSHPTLSPGINVLEAQASDVERFRKVSELSSILRQRWGVDSFGARTEELLRNSLYTLAAANQTLAQLPVLLTDTEFRRECVDQVEHADIAMYWRDRYEPLSEGMKAVFREPLLNRVTGFLTEPAARHLLGQQTSTVDVASVMARGQWLIVRLPKGRLREHAHTLGNLLFAQLQFAVLARESVPRHLRQTFTLLCDEVQNLAENDLATLITEGRKFGVSVITANQFWEQLPRELRGALLSAASHVCFRISSQDASILGAELSLERRGRLTLDLTQLTRGEAIGRFGAQTLRRFRVPPMTAVTPLSPTDLERLIAPVSRSRRDVEAALARRIAERPPAATPPRVTPATEGQDAW